MKRLGLQDNEIHALPGEVFAHLTQLEILSLRKNQLTELQPVLFKKLTSLRTLELTGNQITKVCLDELSPRIQSTLDFNGEMNSMIN